MNGERIAQKEKSEGGENEKVDIGEDGICSAAAAALLPSFLASPESRVCVFTSVVLSLLTVLSLIDIRRSRINIKSTEMFFASWLRKKMATCKYSRSWKSF